MNKQEFLVQLRKGLTGLPEADIEERLDFYGEMVDDRIEDGIPEEDAVCGIGSIDDIVSQIIADTPLTKIVKERIKPKRKMSAWEIVLIVLGSPIWLSVMIAVFAVILAVYITLWSAIIALWAVFAALAVCGAASAAAGVILAFRRYILTGIAAIGAGFVTAGLAILAFFGCRIATRGILMLTKKLAVWIKNCFIRKEMAK